MKKQGKHFSIIQKDMAIDGNVSVKGEIVIGGTLKGTLSAGRVIISEGGDVFAKIRAHSITIAGRFSGEIHAKEVAIVESGVCAGDVKCTDLVIDPGGALNASVTRIGEVRPKARTKSNPHVSSHEKAAATVK